MFDKPTDNFTFFELSSFHWHKIMYNKVDNTLNIFRKSKKNKMNQQLKQPKANKFNYDFLIKKKKKGSLTNNSNKGGWYAANEL